MSIFCRKPKYSLPFIAFFQALGLTLYIILIGLLFWKGTSWFGPLDSFLGPTLFIIIFATSALVSSILTLGYPFILFWEHKKTKEALNLVIYTTGWLIVFVLLIVSIFFVFSK